MHPKASLPIVVLVGALTGWAALVHGQAPSDNQLWACTQQDGAIVFSDRELTAECVPLEDLPSLQRSPHPPKQESRSVADTDSAPEIEPVVPPPTPIPGGGRRSDPPANASITIRDVDAVPNFNSVLGIAQYRATMELENVDSTWTAEKVCVDVRFRDLGRIFVDVHQVGCLRDLMPFVPKTLTITWTGVIPPRAVPIDAEAAVDFVQWRK
jgi:hypothetical protein